MDIGKNNHLHFFVLKSIRFYNIAQTGIGLVEGPMSTERRGKPPPISILGAIIISSQKSHGGRPQRLFPHSADKGSLADLYRG